MSLRLLTLIAAVGALEVAGPSVAHAERVHSYAYVVAVNYFQPENLHSWYCSIHAEIPKAVLAGPPSRASHELLEGATEVNDRFESGESACRAALHTWLPVSFDPEDRSDAELSWPGHGFWAHVAGIALLFVVILLIRYWLKRRKKKAASAAPQ